mgnify:CR=1 FL=1
MKKIGLTGGIGSGKTFVANIIEKMGYPVYYSDNRSKELSNNHPAIREQLIEAFGDEVYQNDLLNKSFLSNEIFSFPESRQRVNEIIHPIVRADFLDWTEKHKNKSLVFNEAAILFETNAFKNFDANVLIYAPEEIRIKRILERDKISMDQIKNKMESQWSDTKKMSLTRYHILNDGHSPLLEQLEGLLKNLINKQA